MGGIQVHIVLAPHLEKNWLFACLYSYINSIKSSTVNHISTNCFYCKFFCIVDIMKKILLPLAIIIFLASCASTTNQSNKGTWVFQDVETSGNWQLQNVEDPLDGDWQRSYVSFNVKEGFMPETAFILVDKYANGQISVGIRNGDYFTCSFDNTIRVKFEDMSVQSWGPYDFRLSDDNETYWLRSDFGDRRAVFLMGLGLMDSVIIETKDGCGDVRQMNFDISGTPHVVAKKIYN